jgi:uncharacterized cupin superfamily protein
MPKHTVNLDELEFTRDLEHGDAFEASFAPVGPVVGSVNLACNVTSVPPGKRAFPFHNHHVIEELFFILDGEGILRFCDREDPVRSGDFIACPAGGPEVAHQLINTGSTALRYLALSTEAGADVVQYPDSGKFGVVAGRTPGMMPSESPFAGFYEEDRKLGYWDGE